MAAKTEENKTAVASYFVSNYPPYSQWKSENVPAANEPWTAQFNPRPLSEAEFLELFECAF